MTNAEKFQLFLSYAISFSLLLAIAVALYNAQWFNAFLAGLAFVLTYIPSIVEKRFKIYLPIEFEFILIAFFYAAIYLGSVRGYYASFWWWDVFLHTTSGVLLGMIGFLIVYVLNSERKFDIQLSPLFISLFSFVFAVALGALWEVYEFCLDVFLGFQMQDDSLVDTMTDIIVDSLGALFIAILGGLYVKNVKVSLFEVLMKKFERKNPKLFGRWRENR